MLYITLPSYSLVHFLPPFHLGRESGGTEKDRQGCKLHQNLITKITQSNKKYRAGRGIEGKKQKRCIFYA
ncbi:MAG: hypothetical protein D3904_13790 [Candidatus Electrothrix sp. EH2]|nr:hypothetical protein [Candidatus Electrothrix sp. EH2]